MNDDTSFYSTHSFYILHMAQFVKTNQIQQWVEIISRDALIIFRSFIFFNENGRNKLQEEI